MRPRKLLTGAFVCAGLLAAPLSGAEPATVHRADRITGPYEGRVALHDQGVAQGGLIDTPSGDWYAYLFQDHGAVGRIPFLVPVTWKDGWPVLGIEGKVPDTLPLPASKGLIPGIVASDEFLRRLAEPALPLVWQWNHNPDNGAWSLKERLGFLRLKTRSVCTGFLDAQNTLTQRTFGPKCTGSIALECGRMKDGDTAGLAALQIEMNFKDRSDTALFYYSLDGVSWQGIGNALKMTYTLPHFMGYRFALFNYATLSTGGFVDFDYFRIEE